MTETEDQKRYNLDEHQPEIKAYFLAQPEFRAIEIHGKFFIQYRTINLEKMEGTLPEFVFYEKLADAFWNDGNELGYDSLEEAKMSLIRYLCAPATAKIHPLIITKLEPTK